MMATRVFRLGKCATYIYTSLDIHLDTRTSYVYYIHSLFKSSLSYVSLSHYRDNKSFWDNLTLSNFTRIKLTFYECVDMSRLAFISILFILSFLMAKGDKFYMSKLLIESGWSYWHSKITLPLFSVWNFCWWWVAYTFASFASKSLSNYCIQEWLICVEINLIIQTKLTTKVIENFYCFLSFSIHKKIINIVALDFTFT